MNLLNPGCRVAPLLYDNPQRLRRCCSLREANHNLLSGEQSILARIAGINPHTKMVSMNTLLIQTIR